MKGERRYYDYRKAMTIGQRADGYILCTYAQFFDEAGQSLYTIQRRDAVYGRALINGDATSMDDVANANATDWQTVVLADGVQAGIDGELIVYADMPLVEIQGEILDTPHIPCRLLDGAREILLAAIRNAKLISQWSIYRVNDVMGGRKLEKVVYVKPDYNTYANAGESGKYHYEIEHAKVLHPKYQKLQELLLNGGTFYIKPAAFDWYVTELRDDISYTDPETGETINYTSERLAKAEENLKMARAILLGSTATLIL